MWFSYINKPTVLLEDHLTHRLTSTSFNEHALEFTICPNSPRCFRRCGLLHRRPLQYQRDTPVGPERFSRPGRLRTRRMGGTHRWYRSELRVCEYQTRRR